MKLLLSNFECFFYFSVHVSKTDEKKEKIVAGKDRDKTSWKYVCEIFPLQFIAKAKPE